MQRWSDAAFEQERLLGTLRHNPLFREYITDFQESAYEESFPDGMMLTLHEHLLQEADPMYVSMEVVDMWDHARESFKAEVLHAWDLPTPISFALLPKQMVMGPKRPILLLRSRLLFTRPAHFGWDRPRKAQR